MTIKRIDAGPRMSMASIHNGVVYLAGQTAHDTSEDIEGQTRQVLAQIDAMLDKAGTERAKLLQVQVFLADMRDLNRMNKVYDAWIVGGNAPGRTTVQAAISSPQKLVEITCTAAL